MVDKGKEALELYARLDDIRGRAENGDVGISHFLTEAEIRRAELYLKKIGARCFFWGGYTDAERKRAYILPEYMDNVESGNEAEMLANYGFSSRISALLISGSGYERLTHRDFLGSLLGLGLERSVLGDIVVLPDGEKSAVVFCDEQISHFICSELSKVARDKVKLKEIEIEEDFLPQRRFLDITEPISSTRLDCIVSALCSVSRERAGELILAGYVDIEFETEEKPDRRIELPCVMSVRGFGKYKLLRADTRTKRGRYRLEAQKYL